MKRLPLPFHLDYEIMLEDHEEKRRTRTTDGNDEAAPQDESALHQPWLGSGSYGESYLLHARIAYRFLGLSGVQARPTDAHEFRVLLHGRALGMALGMAPSWPGVVT